jgi:hypothetical protein
LFSQLTQDELARKVGLPQSSIAKIETGRFAEAESAESGEAGNLQLRFSLGGVQLKFSAVMESRGGLTIPVNGVGGSWIVNIVMQSVSESVTAFRAVWQDHSRDLPIPEDIRESIEKHLNLVPLFSQL